MADDNRIEVQLTLIGNEDVDRLVKALNSFHGNLGTSRPSGQIGPGGSAPGVARGTPLYSQMSASEKLAVDAQRGGAMGSVLAQRPQTISQKAGAFMSPKNLYNELPGGNLLQKMAYGLAFGPQAVQNLKGIAGAFGGAAYGGGFSAAGVQTGLSNDGYMGSGLLSPAFQQGAQNFTTTMANLFDPNMGAAIGIAQAYGWKGTEGWTTASNVSKFISKSMAAGAGEDASAQWIEQMRYGGTNIAGLTERIHALGDTARAAHIGVANLTQQLTAAATAMSSSTGGSTAYSTDQIMALSRATGLTPGALQPMMTNKTLQGMSIAAAGGDMAKAVYGRNAGLNNIMAMERMIAPQLGYANFKEVAAALKNPQKKHDIINRLLWLYQGSPDLFNGMSVSELITMIQNTGGTAGIASGMHAAQDIQHGAQTNFNADRIARELTAAGVHVNPDLLHASGMTAKDRIAALSNAQQGWMGKKAEKQSTAHVSLTLTGYAEKVFKKAAQNEDVAHRNDSHSTGTPANTYMQGPYGK